MKSEIVAKALEQGLIYASDEQAPVGCTIDAAEQDRPCAFFQDLDAYTRNVEHAKKVFGETFFHAAAVKTNPLEWYIKYNKTLGLGAECASMAEVKLSLQAGMEPHKVVFDSPCKTIREIEAALAAGVHLNIDNIQELEKVKIALERLEKNGTPSVSNVGLRINPLLGMGAVAALSVSTGKSKFGCPLPPLEGEGANKELHERMRDIVAEHSFVNCIHVHSGSGGMGLKKLCAGAKVVVDFAKEVNEVRKAKGIEKVIDILDIGGGVAAYYEMEPEKTIKDFTEYAETLRKITPEMFDPTIFKQVITEFGASLQCNFGWFASRVEYNKSYENHNIALIHGGSDLFVRAAYCPKKFVNYQVEVYTNRGELKAKENRDAMEGSTTNYDIAGPLCFAGDIVCRDVPLPKRTVIEPGDVVVINDCGGNSISLKNMHCSRPIPAVYGYRKTAKGVEFEEIKGFQTLDNLVSFWK